MAIFRRGVCEPIQNRAISREDTKVNNLAEIERNRRQRLPQVANSVQLVWFLWYPFRRRMKSHQGGTRRKSLRLSTAFETHVIAFAVAASLSRRSSSGPRTLVRSPSHRLHRVVSNATVVPLPSQLLDRPPITRQPFYSRPPLYLMRAPSKEQTTGLASLAGGFQMSAPRHSAPAKGWP